VQSLMAKGDERAKQIYATIGTYLGYGVAHFASFHDIQHVLLLGRVTSGAGGNEILSGGAGPRRRFPGSCEADRIPCRTNTRNATAGPSRQQVFPQSNDDDDDALPSMCLGTGCSAKDARLRSEECGVREHPAGEKAAELILDVFGRRLNGNRLHVTSISQIGGAGVAPSQR
jgi:hypothetical protein